MTLSVIVPTYLMSPEVHDLWASNRRQLEDVATVPTEIIVVDNGSTHPPAQVTTGWLENRGVAPAWNEGVRRSHGTLLAFVTCTTRVEPGWDAKLCAVAQSGRFIAMPIHTNGERPYGLGPTGWCWVIQRALWDEVGPFDETFVPVQYEDVEFMHRAIYHHGIELVSVVGVNVTRPKARATWNSAPFAAEQRRIYIHWANRFRYSFKHGVDPMQPPPFWQQPLRVVEA